MAKFISLLSRFPFIKVFLTIKQEEEEEEEGGGGERG